MRLFLQKPLDWSGRLRKGFTLIELMIVISLFGVAASLITLSYLTFEQNQRLKNAALALKSDIRLAQSDALSGNKSSVSCTGSTAILVGWFVYVDDVGFNGTRYQIGAGCKDSVSYLESEDTAVKTVNFPSGVTVSSIKYGATTLSSGARVTILFRPLTSDATFWSVTAPPFLKSGATMTDLDTSKLLGSQPQPALTIILTGPSSSTYQVVVNPSGEVNEIKP